MTDSFLPPEVSGTVVTVGTFDGVHQGHRAVLSEIAERARRLELKSVLVTFEPHPLEVVNPQAAPQRLTVGRERHEMLAQCEIDYVLILPFDRNLSLYTPREFVRLLQARLRLRELVVGYDHGLGKGRTGDVGVLQDLGRELGFDVDVVSAVTEHSRPVSSTLIRRAIAGGDLDTAAELLGRSYSLTGRVVRGAGRGGELGYPTVNVEIPDPRKLLPPDGVYAVTAEWDSGVAGGMMNQGPRPTFGEADRTLEVHLFDTSDDLYGREVKIAWVKRVRDVRTFPSVAALREQLGRDESDARSALTAAGANTSH